MDQETKEQRVQDRKSRMDQETKVHGDEDQRSRTDQETKVNGDQDQETKMNGDQDQKSRKDQETKEQGVVEEREKPYLPKEPDFLRYSLEDDDSTMKDPFLSEKIPKLVLDEYQSQGTQTSQRRLPSAFSSLDTSWDEELERTKRALADSKKSGIKPVKSASEYFDENSFPENLSRDLKDRFITLNLKHATVVPEDFKIYVDCKQFRSSEVKVTIEDDFVVVRAKHQQKFDDHGVVKREFTRRWCIPEDVKRDKIKCLFNRYNILTIQAPRKPSSIDVPVQNEMLQGWKTSEV